MLKTLCLIVFLGMCAAAMADEHPRTITVNGSGFAEIEPDRATLQMSIVSRAPTVAAAQKETADITNKVLKMTDRMKIDRDQVDTTGVSVRADYRWNREKEEQELRGYIATRQITVVIRDLEKLGAVVEAAVGAGVNQVSPPQLDSSKRKQAHRKALRAAAEDARANAQELAGALGSGLGQVVSIDSRANESWPPAPRTAGVRAMAAESDAVESYNAANLRFDAAVTVVFELME